MKRYTILVIHIFDTKKFTARGIARACSETLRKYEKKQGSFKKPFAYQGGVK